MTSKEDYVGLTEAEARELAKKRRVEFRVRSEDGENFALITNFVAGRSTATVENGKVASYTTERK